jgi:hypothetical protein
LTITIEVWRRPQNESKRIFTKESIKSRYPQPSTPNIRRFICNIQIKALLHDRNPIFAWSWYRDQLFIPYPFGAITNKHFLKCCSLKNDTTSPNERSVGRQAFGHPAIRYFTATPLQTKISTKNDSTPSNFLHAFVNMLVLSSVRLRTIYPSVEKI